MSATEKGSEQVSILAYRGFDQKLISRETALELAKAILKDAFGDAEAARQGQLTAVEAEGWWRITGSPQRRTGGAYESASNNRAVEMEISQFDCRIRKLTFD